MVALSEDVFQSGFPLTLFVCVLCVYVFMCMYACVHRHGVQRLHEVSYSVAIHIVF